MSVLDKIIAYKLEEVAARKQRVSPSELHEAIKAQSAPRGFANAIRSNPERRALIAEIKKASPSKGLIRANFNPPELARAYSDGGATCLSVLTDGPSFRGADEYLVAARAAVSLPVLRKDFIVDPWQALESRALGADAVLIIMAACEDELAGDIADMATSVGMDYLVEVHDERELERALKFEGAIIGINNRSLKTFETDLATTERLAAYVPRTKLLVSESGIATADDINRLRRTGARAFLVGESLMREADVAAATRRLLGH
ncbi:MAG TPA: indole-3-glycerol phosphate synthase TrpC [Candidatus Binatia bacterium]|nr:indole-3-glycerol phosphate synthase TrpC [Candidatus Binatia bacterium]